MGARRTFLAEALSSASAGGDARRGAGRGDTSGPGGVSSLGIVDDGGGGLLFYAGIAPGSLLSNNFAVSASAATATPHPIHRRHSLSDGDTAAHLLVLLWRRPRRGAGETHTTRGRAPPPPNRRTRSTRRRALQPRDNGEGVALCMAPGTSTLFGLLSLLSRQSSRNRGKQPAGALIPAT